MHVYTNLILSAGFQIEFQQRISVGTFDGLIVGTEVALRGSQDGISRILLESISKAYNIPGLRIGYLVASPEIAEKVNMYIIPWSVNAIAIEASKYILIHPAQFTLPIRKWQRETADFIYQLSKLDGLEVIPTSTTFFLVRLKKGTAADLKQFLLDNYGILIRDASNFRGLDETYLRLSTQKADENQILLEGVKVWLEQQ